ncbi:hypothetical protein H696_03872 [Fonticula alba]|uniref:Uncharacterized protein n=1 Tax=Fonticula alba TaxID=691883 RepID=A0A058Z6A0_FONAL|nr:hypothetical protein H696_03872 [Fonticula alba]KCV69443.1 hypothetical protein H696_03872 [Fonticula alba]|eukprot:XP_009496008.1 hypothetical protein H696_03872 [Fonticula alba]
MDVTSATFREMLPQIVEEINRADFYAIDTELSGLFANDSVPGPGDSLHDFYQKVSRSCRHPDGIAILQYGLCLVRWNSTDKCFETRTYNFYLCPRSSEHLRPSNRCFSFQYSGMDFLRKFNFDFNKWIYEGINFLTHEQQAELEFQKGIGHIPDLIAKQMARAPEGTATTMATFMKDIATWLQSPSEPLSIPMSYQEHLLLNLHIRQAYGFSLQGKFRHGALSIARCTDEEKAALEAAHATLATDMADLIGFRSVIDELIKARIPLVGHNLFLDLLHTYSKFVEPNFPPSLYDVSKRIHEAFPRTKLPAFDLVKIHTPPAFGKYTDDSAAFHEAGFDAYCTAVVFLKLAALNHHLVLGRPVPTAVAATTTATSPIESTSVTSTEGTGPAAVAVAQSHAAPAPGPGVLPATYGQEILLCPHLLALENQLNIVAGPFPCFSLVNAEPILTPKMAADASTTDTPSSKADDAAVAAMEVDQDVRTPETLTGTGEPAPAVAPPLRAYVLSSVPKDIPPRVLLETLSPHATAHMYIRPGTGLAVVSPIHVYSGDDFSKVLARVFPEYPISRMDYRTSLSAPRSKAVRSALRDAAAAAAAVNANATADSVATTATDSVATAVMASIATANATAAADSIATTAADSITTAATDSITTAATDSVATAATDSVATTAADSVATTAADSVATTAADSIATAATATTATATVIADTTATTGEGLVHAPEGSATPMEVTFSVGEKRPAEAIDDVPSKKHKSAVEAAN